MQQSVSERSAVSTVNQIDFQKKYASYQNVLKGAKKGEVVTRFPPEPSGCLHIGHVKAILLNYHYSKIYDGKMLLRFDDTNPSKEKEEFVDSILADLKILGVEYSKLSYSSDYFDQTEALCKQMLAKGQAYCDNTEVDVMRDQRGKGVESKCRDQLPERNLEIFQELTEGKSSDYCVRAKMSMKHKNKCMRDPVFYRGQATPHHRTGTKYHAYPTYDFVCPILDSIEGVTHALRTSEYADRIEQYQWVQKTLELRPVEIYEFSRFNLVNTCMSKRKLQALVDTKVVEGWEDPRFPTVKGILRRGIKVETLVEFMLEQGPSKNATLMEWDKLWATNIKIIDPICPRYTAIGKEQIATLKIINYKGQGIDVISTPQHPKNPELGDRAMFKAANLFMEKEDASLVVPEEKITLMRWGNVKVLTVDKNEQTGVIHITAEDLPDDKDYKGTKKMSWISQECSHVQVELVEFDHLIKVKKVEEDMKLEDIINVNSKFVTHAIAEPGLRSLTVGDSLQFERRGYFRIDSIRQENSNTTYTLIFIPDGRTKGLASIATKVDQATLSKGKQEVESKDKPKKQEKQKKEGKPEKGDKPQKEDKEGLPKDQQEQQVQAQPQADDENQKK